jgi:hypothetical protein
MNILEPTLHLIKPKTTNYNFNILTYLGSTLLCSTSDDELFLKKGYMYVILVHILGRERCICYLWNFINVFAFVSKHIEIFRDQIQMRCLLHMLL